MGLRVISRRRSNSVALGAKRTFSDRDYLMSEKGAALKREILIGRFVTGTTIVADGGQMVALRG
jgi:hypothetical protein